MFELALIAAWVAQMVHCAKPKTQAEVEEAKIRATEAEAKFKSEQ